MFFHIQNLINPIAADEPDPAAANILQEGLGGQFGEMRTMMQYLFQSINFRGDPASKPYKDLLQGVGTEEISHVELIGTTIALLAGVAVLFGAIELGSVAQGIATIPEFLWELSLGLYLIVKGFRPSPILTGAKD